MLGKQACKWINSNRVKTVATEVGTRKEGFMGLGVVW